MVDRVCPAEIWGGVAKYGKSRGCNIRKEAIKDDRETTDLSVMA